MDNGRWTMDKPKKVPIYPACCGEVVERNPNAKAQITNQCQNQNVKMFSKTISYLTFLQHLNKYGHPHCFPLLQRGIEGDFPHAARSY